MADDFLIHNGLLLTMETGLPVVQNGAVLVRDGVIEDAGPFDDIQPSGAVRRINADGAIIMPGLINCHTHAPMTMFRGLADDLPLDVWLNDHIFPAEARDVNPGSVFKWSCHAFEEMLLAGTTTCCDGYFLEDRVADAMIAAGIRGIAGQGVVDFPAPGVPDPTDNVDHAVRFVSRNKGRSSLVVPAIFCHSPYTCSADTLVRGKQAAEAAGVLFQIHVAETRNEINQVQGLAGRSVIRYLDDLGILDEQTLLVHGVWIDDRDIGLIRELGAAMVHCPESNMKLASGIAPVPKILDAGIRIGLGTDGCASNNDHDLLGEMDMAAKLHKVAAMDPCVMDARTVLKMATITGAQALGLSGLTGSIEKGKRADIILVDTKGPHMVPLNDPYSALVYSAKSSDVRLVMVDGIIRVENGRFVRRPETGSRKPD